MTQAFIEPISSAEERFRLLFDAQAECVFHLSEKGIFLDLNKSVTKILGYARDELLGQKLSLIVSDEGLEDSYKKIMLLRRGETIRAYRKQFRAKSGQMIPFEVNVSATVDENGALIIQSICRDLRKELETERRLKSTEYLMHTFLESAADSIWIKDVDGRFTLTNHATQRLLGKSPDQIQGRTAAELFPSDFALRVKKEDSQVLQEGKTVSSEFTTKIGEKSLTIHNVKVPLRDADGRIIGLLGIGRDMTKERTLSRQLQQAQKLEAVGALAGGIAHDFNNLLTGIIGNLSLCLLKQDSSEDIRQFIHAAYNAAESAAQTTRQLLQISRRQAIDMASVDLKKVVDDVIGLLRSTLDRRINMQNCSESNIWTVEADKTQLQQVLMNLCLNARDALHERFGTDFNEPNANPWCNITLENVTFSANTLPPSDQAKVGDYVRVVVSDNGIGIPQDKIEKVFEPFFTTKSTEKGTGLGMAMVYSIVANHRGWMCIESEPDIGTDVILYLPRSTKKAEAKIDTPTQFYRPSIARKKILLVDDENHIRQLFKRVLQDNDCTVFEAANGLEGWTILKENFPDLDLIVLDLIMPVMSGHEFLRQMQQEGLLVPVLVCSGYTGDLSREELANLGVHGFLEKPFTPVQFIHAVAELLEK